MTTRTRRKKPVTAHGQPVAHFPGTPGAKLAPQGSGWRWRTFPVYFAFAAGGFLGMYTGVIAGSPDTNDTVEIVIFGFWAILLGFGFSRLTSRWMTSRNWGRRFAKGPPAPK